MSEGCSQSIAISPLIFWLSSFIKLYMWLCKKLWWKASYIKACTLPVIVKNINASWHLYRLFNINVVCKITICCLLPISIINQSPNLSLLDCICHWYIFSWNIRTAVTKNTANNVVSAALYNLPVSSFYAFKCYF